MRIGIDYGLEHVELDMPEERLVAVHQEPEAPPLDDPVAAVREALEHPVDFPPLRRALTPDDHVAVVVDPHLPHLAQLLTAVLEHITGAGVSPEAVTLLCPPTENGAGWREQLPVQYRLVRVEVHDPTDRRLLSYLATTKQGRRLYLNRTAVDADQLVVLSRCGYDPLLGYSGAEGAVYPALADEATRQEMCGRLSLAVPKTKPWPVRAEAAEVAWLLGAPFMIQVIQGSGAGIVHVVGGLANTSAEGQRLLNARWRKSVDEQADVVVAAVAGDPAEHGFADLASALACAGRVVKPQGRVVLLSRANPGLGTGAEMVRQASDPEQALAVLRQQAPPDMAAAFQWATAVQRASVYLLSGLHDETAEELFTTPLQHAGQAQRLLDADGTCLFLADAHRSLAVPSARPDAFSEMEPSAGAGIRKR
jgi:nickel-dependent lactate racemase